MHYIKIHLPDAFIQSDLQCIQTIHLYCQYVCSLGIEPTTFALLYNALTTEPQEHDTVIYIKWVWGQIYWLRYRLLTKLTLFRWETSSAALGLIKMIIQI